MMMVLYSGSSLHPLGSGGSPRVSINSGLGEVALSSPLPSPRSRGNPPQIGRDHVREGNKEIPPLLGCYSGNGGIYCRALLCTKYFLPVQ